MPMTPAPITTIRSGTALSESAPEEDTTVSSSIYNTEHNTYNHGFTQQYARVVRTMIFTCLSWTEL